MDLGFSKPTFSQKGSKRTKQTTRHSSFPLISLMPGSVVGIHIHTLIHTNTLSRPIRHVHTHARFFLPSFPSPFVHSARRGLIIPLFCLFDAERRPGGAPPSSPSLSLSCSFSRPTLDVGGARCYLQCADFAFTNGRGVQNARVCAEMEFAFCALRQEHGNAPRSAGQQAVCGGGDSGGGGGVTR